MGVRRDVVLGSAVWAAYGDALGFITELTDTRGSVKHRCGQERVDVPVAWRRRIGGRSGVEVKLPAGAYSDDTQLRLATSRAIRGDGEFDVDSFARVELVAWQTYHLGAGRGSKAAAAAMTRADARWSQNIFDTKMGRYVDVGGNGAAMRIQPHVWSAPDLANVDALLTRVVRDAVTTHGHPVGILGAGLHALMLAATMADGEVPAPARWPGLVADLARIMKVIEADDELAGLWLPAWENAARQSFPQLMAATLDTARDMGATLARIASSATVLTEPGYQQAVHDLGGFDPASRGSGLATAWLAGYVAHVSTDPARSLATVANMLGSDTDTIATMAGAMLGAVTAAPPPAPVQDQELIIGEAARMHAIGSARPAPTFRYPDLLTWAPPRSSLDLIGAAEAEPDDPHAAQLTLAGLGALQDLDEPVSGGRREAPTLYRWATLARTSQRVLVRHRADPSPLPLALAAPPGPGWVETPARSPHTRPGPRKSPVNAPTDPTTSVMPTTRPTRGAGHSPTATGSVGTDATLFETEDLASPRRVAGEVRSVDTLVRLVVEAKFDADVIGRALLEILGDGRTWHPERAAAFAAIVAREYDASRAGR